MHHLERRALCASAAALAFLCAAPARAEGAGQTAPAAAPSREAPANESLAVAKMVENPIANIVATPIQNSTNFGIGPFDRISNVALLQPLIPVSLGDSAHLLTITRIPLVSSPNAASSSGSTFGLGDVSTTVFLSPNSIGDFTWGFGPIIRFPTGTSEDLGPADSGKWSVGPAIAAAYTPGPLVLAIIANNTWSVAGSSSRPSVNALALQPFVDLNFPGGWYLATSPIILADWTQPAGQGWVVPVGGGIGNVTRVSKTTALDLEAQAFANVVRPAFGPTWTMRITVSLALPRFYQQRAVAGR